MQTSILDIVVAAVVVVALKTLDRVVRPFKRFPPPTFFEMSLIIWIESRVKLCEAANWLWLGLSHIPFQPPWQLNASSNQKHSVCAGVQLLGTGGTLRRLTPNNVTSELIESTGVSVILLLRQHWRHSACMWHIQAKQEKCGKNTHMP